ncbi:MAG: TolC family protein [Candidatus Cryptobacteroides sp.]
MKLYRNIALAVLLLSFQVLASAQLTIGDCVEMAVANYPQIKEYDLIDAAERYDLSNASLSWVPQLNISGKASWQSDVVEIPVDIPGLEFNIPHDQYGFTADLTQPLWDGGTAASRKDLARTGAEVKRRQLEVNIYPLRSKVQSVFLGIVLLDKQLELNGLMKQSLNRSLEETRSLAEAGVALASDVDQVSVSLLSCEQQRKQILSDRKAYLRMLSLLVGSDLEGSELVVPENPAVPEEGTGPDRPELALYDAQIEQVGSQRRQLGAAASPRLNLNLQAGYGRPGLNMLSGEFDPYFVAGLKLQWSLGSLYTLKNDRRKADADAGRIETSRSTFLLNTMVESEQKRNDLEKAAEVLADDDAIIELRRSIRESAEKQYREGAIKMNDYLNLLDEEFKAMADKRLHEVQYIMAVYELKNTLGK